MENKEKNIIDKFLDRYEDINNSNIRYKKVYQRPSKFKSLMGFIFSLFVLIILLSMFVFKLLYLILVIGVILTSLYYGINLFTKKGIGLPKSIPVEDEDREE